MQYIRRGIRHAITTTIGICALSYGASPIADPSLIKVGVLSYRGDDHAIRMWQSTADYLSQAIPEYHFQILPHSRVQLTKAAEAGTIDFAITHPLHYVQLEDKGDFAAIATIKHEFAGYVYSDYAGVLFSRKDNADVTTIDDLENKAIAGAQQDGFGALQIAWIEMQLNGIDPFQDLTRTHVTAFSVNDVLTAVRSRVVDAGVMRADTYRRLIDARQIGKSEFKIINEKQSSDYPFIYSTRLYPEWPFVRLTTNETLSDRVRDALLEMTPENIAAQAAQIEGWSPAVDYSSVKAIERNLGVGESSHRNIWLWRQYWWIFLTMSAAIAVLFWYGLKMREHLKTLHDKHLSLSGEVDEQKNSAETINRQHDQTQSAIAAIDVAVVRTTLDGAVDYTNDAAKKLLHLEDNARQDWHSLSTELKIDVSGKQYPLQELALRAISENKTIRLKHNASLKNEQGLLIDAVAIHFSPMLGNDQNVIGCVITIRDVSVERETERKIRQIASRDSLTGLLNRAEFERQLSQAILAAQNKHATPVMLYLDLDQFKQVNDIAGHNAGDELLRRLTSQLNGLIENNQCLARLGGDEFGLLLPNSDIDRASRVAERLRESIASFHFVWNNRRFDIGVSIGIVAITDRMNNVIEVLQAADKACFVAKDSGRNRVYVYTENDEDIAQHTSESNWSNRIGSALKKGKFVLDAQIIQPTAPKQIGPYRFEVLLRMLDEHGNRVLPKLFLPAAERFKQMAAIDRWVVERTFYNLNEYELRYPDQIRCHINLSAQTLADKEFIRFVIDCFEIYDIAPGAIVFELLESSAVANPQRTNRVTNVLRGIGCQFAIDNFGSCLSSFFHLKEFSIDYLKIDGDLIRKAASDRVSEVMVRSIEQISHTMNIDVIAEGVEGDEVIKKIKRMPFDFVQGQSIVPVQPLLSILSHQQAVAI